jgi:hypothetical protein
MEHDGDPAGQHRTVGATLMGMGSFFGAVAVLLIGSETQLDMAFISPHGMLFFSTVFVLVGLWQWRLAKRYRDA